MRFLGDIGILFNKFGSFSAEYEFVDYSKAKLSARDYGFGDENSIVRDSYQSTHNIRLGTEWRLSSLSLRAGYAIYSSPYAKNLNDGARQSISFGLGYKFGFVDVDFAYVRWTKDEDYYMYSSENIQPNASQNSFIGQNFVLSLRSRF